MCGIAGLINLSGSLRSREMAKLALRMADRMPYRGPDDSGVWVDPSSFCALSQRRLSIIDTSAAGHQPMASADGRRWITFNGEIYNFLEIRKDLENRGVRFQGRTDTEVLIEALKAYGDDTFAKLDGMYAFALFDQDTQEVIIGRDPFGEKPLYYTEQNGYFAFSSELHSLTVLPNFDASLDEEAIAEYFGLQYIHAPRTIYRKAKKLPPGHFLRLDRRSSEITIKRHFSFSPSPGPFVQRSLDDLADELGDILIRSVKRRMISDVPLGAFLSGGVDSSLVVALMRKALGSDVKTFSIGFEGAEDSEHLYAREMAYHLGADHNERMLVPNVLNLAHTIGRVLDEPNADTSCLPTYLLSEFARKKVTVSLSGDGGDEMFGGYGRYFSTLTEDDAKSRGDANLAEWNPGNAYFSSRIMVFAEGDLKQLLGFIPPETQELLADFKGRLNSPSLPLLSRMRAIDTVSYMPGAVLAKVDRMSMQHSLEVRCPILSREVAAFAEKLDPASCYREGQGKLVLKQLASRYIPMEWLTRKKMGFGLPMMVWGREELLKALRTLCLSKDSLAHHWIGMRNMNAFVTKQEHPNTFSTYQVWTMIIFEIWLRHHLSKHEEIPAPTFWQSMMRRSSGALQNVFGMKS